MVNVHPKSVQVFTNNPPYRNFDATGASEDRCSGEGRLPLHCVRCTGIYGPRIIFVRGIPNLLSLKGGGKRRRNPFMH